MTSYPTKWASNNNLHSQHDEWVPFGRVVLNTPSSFGIKNNIVGNRFEVYFNIKLGSVGGYYIINNCEIDYVINLRCFSITRLFIPGDPWPAYIWPNGTPAQINWPASTWGGGINGNPLPTSPSNMLESDCIFDTDSIFIKKENSKPLPELPPECRRDEFGFTRKGIDFAEITRQIASNPPGKKT